MPIEYIMTVDQARALTQTWSANMPTDQQNKYINSIDDPVHKHAYEVIGIMERALISQAEVVACLFLDDATKDEALQSMAEATKAARDIGIDI